MCGCRFIDKGSCRREHLNIPDVLHHFEKKLVEKNDKKGSIYRLPNRT